MKKEKISWWNTKFTNEDIKNVSNASEGCVTDSK